jgi:hypothetical protein
MGGRLNDYVDEGVAIGIAHHLFNYADRKTAGKDHVAAGGKHDFTGLDALVGEDADNLRLADGVASQGAANARGCQDDAGTAGLVVDLKHLRGVGKDFADFAHDAVGRDDRHVAFQLVVGAFVNVEEPRLIAAAGSDGLRGYGLVDVLLLEADEGLEALALLGVFKQGGLLKAQAVDGLLQILVLLLGVAEVDVVLPEPDRAEAGRMKEPLGRRDRIVGPHADETHAGAVLGIEGVAAGIGVAHLDGQTHDLRQENGQQDQKIPIADEEGFHGFEKQGLRE